MNERIAFLAPSLLCVACDTPSRPIDRIEAHRPIYATLPLEVRQLLLDGRVMQGMTGEMVFLAWGWPVEADGERWVYEVSLGGRQLRREVSFRNGKVTDVVTTSRR